MGFRTLVSIAETGHEVCVVVPRKEDIDLIRDAPSVKRLHSSSNLSFVVIPDISADGGLSSVMVGVTSIVHTDYPTTITNVSPDHFESQIIQPFVKATKNILSAANNFQTERVVMASSLMGLAPYMELYQLESFNTFTNASPVPTPDAPYPTTLAALCAGHAKALTATNAYLDKNKPHFTVVNLMPSIIIGRDELAKTAKDFLKGGNLQALRHLRGEKVSSKLPSQTVYIDDVAKVLRLALDTKKLHSSAKAQNFVLSSGGVSGVPWYRAKEIVKEDYMDAVKKGWLSLDGEQPINRVLMDSRETLKLFGIKLTGFDKQIKSLLDQWVALKAKEEKK